MSKETLPYEVDVKLRVIVVPGHVGDIEKVVWHYLKDFIPDEGKEDVVHIQDFVVGKALPAGPLGSNPELSFRFQEPVQVKNAILHSLLSIVRQEIVDKMTKKMNADQFTQEGFAKVLQYWDLAIAELVRAMRQHDQEICWLLVRSACLLTKAFKIEGLTGPEHLLGMRRAFGLAELSR